MMAGAVSLQSSSQAVQGGVGQGVAVTSFRRPWIAVFVLPEKSTVLTERDLDPKGRKMSITF